MVREFVRDHQVSRPFLYFRSVSRVAGEWEERELEGEEEREREQGVLQAACTKGEGNGNAADLGNCENE